MPQETKCPRNALNNTCFQCFMQKMQNNNFLQNQTFRVLFYVLIVTVLEFTEKETSQRACCVYECKRCSQLIFCVRRYEQIEEEVGLRNQNSTFLRSLKSESAQNSTKDRTRYENKFQLDDNVEYYRNGTFPLQAMIQILTILIARLNQLWNTTLRYLFSE